MAEMDAPSSAVSDVFVSLVVIDGSETAELAQRTRTLHAAVSARYANYELIIVDNGFPMETLVQLRELLAELPCIRVLRLARGDSSIETAAFAGIEAAIGDFVAVTTPSIDPVEDVLAVVERARSGSDVVQGISTTTHGGGVLSRIGRNLFYWYNRRFLQVAMSERATYLTGLSRRAVNSLSAASRSQRYLRHLVHHIGFRTAEHEYRPLRGSERHTLRNGARAAIEMVSSYSSHPLRIVTAVGIIASILNLAYAGYVVVVNLVVRDVADGWTTTSLQLSLMFFLVSLILAIQAEYIGRILAESRREPSYYILEELESETLIADLDRRNVSG